MTLALLLLLTGCGHRDGPALDPRLPDEPALHESRAPAELLVALAAHDDPTLRGRALSVLARRQPDAWARRALADPDGWVQQLAVDALLPLADQPVVRDALAEHAARSWADPIARARVAHALPDLGLAASWSGVASRWDRLPLALVAAAQGDADALAEVQARLSRGEVLPDTQLVLDVGRTGLSELLPSMVEGQDWVEEELAAPWAGARLLLGDTSAEGVLRRALSDDLLEAQLQAVDVLASVPTPESDALLDRASSRGPDAVRWYAALTLSERRGPDAGLLERAASHEDRDVRVIALQAVPRLLAASDNRRLARSAERILRDGLSDPDPLVRLAALRALVDSGRREPAAAVRELYADDLLEIQLEAAIFLTESPRRSP